MAFSEINLLPFLEHLNHLYDEEEMEDKLKLSNGDNFIRSHKSVQINQSKTIDIIHYIYTKGLHGFVELEETYLVEDYTAEKPYRLVEFIYQIRIDSKYLLHIHYHPDSDCKKHAFVHIHGTKENNKEVRFYLNPIKSFNMDKTIETNEKSEHCLWDSKKDWGNYFVRILESHSRDYKNVDINDCMKSIFNNLGHKSKFEF